MGNDPEALRIMGERFGKDSLISIATWDGDRPSVRQVDGYYEDGAFYVVTYARSNKMRQIAAHPEVGLCGEWFQGHGIGQNLGHPHDPANAAIMGKLRLVFAAWYNDGDVDEDDPDTCVLRLSLTDGVLFDHGTRYELVFGL